MLRVLFSILILKTLRVLMIPALVAGGAYFGFGQLKQTEFSDPALNSAKDMVVHTVGKYAHVGKNMALEIFRQLNFGKIMEEAQDARRHAMDEADNREDDDR